MFVDGIERQDCLVHLDDDIDFTSPDGVFLKGMILNKAGLVVAQHAHKYGHTSLLAHGSVRVWKENILIGDYKAPAFIFIEAEAKHKFQSLEDNTSVYCIHNVSQTGGNVAIHSYSTLEDVR